MADEFNLVPTNNLEKHLDNILRAASGDAPQYDLAPNWRVEQYLAAIAAKLSGGGSGGLPPVTESDNGDTLMVKNGAWTADSNLFLVTISLNASYTNVADKTFSEIMDAINNGRTVICLRSDKYYVYQSSTSTGICFMSADKTTNLIKISSTNSVSMSTNGYMPNVGYSENGKILISKDGAWQVVDKKFVVTLTPTSPDFSGTMDKTAQEITNAYNAGQEIEFDIPSLSSKCKAMEFAVYNGLINAGAIVTYRTGGSHLLIEILTSTSATDTTTYVTTIYTLTPAT